MLGGFPLIRIVGMAAGALILFIGIFVLRAKPDSRLHQLFFALAVADGVSTFAYELGLSPVAEVVRLHAVLLYYYSFIAFLALLIGFGVMFPKPVLRGAGRRPLMIALALAALVAAAAMAIDHTLFWAPVRRSGEIVVSLAPAGRSLLTAFVLATGFIIVRTTVLLRQEVSPSHRLQGALVLGGMALGYAPFATTTVIVGLRAGSSATFFAPAWDVAMSYWAALLTTLCVIASAASIFLESRADRERERRILLACFAGVLVLALFALPTNARAAADTAQVIGVLAYPILLGYAIARYEVLDIDAHVRRAATASLLGAGFTAAFLLFEVFLEQILQSILSLGVTATVVASIVAALLTAIVSVPLARILRKAATRIAPTLSTDDLQMRKREIYRHALHGAALDGVIAPNELRVLQRLRESLQISEADHSAIMREVGVAA